jgi:creatinine amidohydrolase
MLGARPIRCYAVPMTLLLQTLTWPDIEQYLERDDRLILVAGSTEQHGRHLPFASDVLVPWEIGRRLSERCGVLLAPPLNYGMSLHHLGFPGSLSLRPSTLAAVLQDLLESAYEHGFRHVLLLNGHGGNTAALQTALAEVLYELPDLEVRLGSWWTEPTVKAVLGAAFGDEPAGHSDAGETSVVLAVRPGDVHLERAQHSPGAPSVSFLTREAFLRHYPHGVIGADPKRASAPVGEQVLAAAVEAYERVLEEWGPRSRVRVRAPGRESLRAEEHTGGGQDRE